MNENQWSCPRTSEADEIHPQNVQDHVQELQCPMVLEQEHVGRVRLRGLVLRGVHCPQLGQVPVLDEPRDVQERHGRLDQGCHEVRNAGEIFSFGFNC